MTCVSVTLFIIISIDYSVEAFSWYSTIDQMKNLSLQDQSMLKDVEERLKEGEIVIKQLLSTTEALKGETLRHLNKLEVGSGSMESIEWRNFFQDQAKLLLTHSTFPFNVTILEKYAKILLSFPGLKDYEAVLKTLHNLQKSYGLDVEQLSRGWIFGKFSGEQLSGNACFQLAQLTCGADSLERCCSWVEEAIKKVDDETAHYDRDHVAELRSVAVMKKEFSRLCEASLNRSYVENSTASKLKCYFWDNLGNPWLLLQPVKTEVMSISPHVIVFYNVISDTEITHIKDRATPLLGKAITFDFEESIKLDSYRVAHNCWLSKNNDSIIKKLDYFVEAITGLKARQSQELLQVANYGIGGQYGLHTDPMEFETPEKEIRRRNRKATFMFYLSDVEYGGATAFAHNKVAIKPTKGAAVFWNNLESTTGMPDGRTLHGSCPVLLGSKWVANKWIWETKKEICMSKDHIELIH